MSPTLNRYFYGSSFALEARGHALRSYDGAPASWLIAGGLAVTLNVTEHGRYSNSRVRFPSLFGLMSPEAGVAVRSPQPTSFYLRWSAPLAVLIEKHVALELVPLSRCCTRARAAASRRCGSSASASPGARWAGRCCTSEATRTHATIRSANTNPSRSTTSPLRIAHRLREHRPGVRERMKLATLAARIDRRVQRGQVRQQRRVEVAAGEAGRQLPRIDAGQPRAQAGGHHVVREHVRRDAPDRKQRRQAGPAHPVLAIAPDVFEEEVAERDRLDAVPRARSIAAAIAASYCALLHG